MGPAHKHKILEVLYTFGGSLYMECLKHLLIQQLSQNSKLPHCKQQHKALFQVLPDLKMCIKHISSVPNSWQ